MSSIFFDLDSKPSKAFNATLDNAMSAFNFHFENHFSQWLKSIVAFEGHFICKENIVQIINNILSKSVGEKASKSVSILPEYKQEIALFCFENKIPVYYPEEDSESVQVHFHKFIDSFKLEDFSFFKNNRYYPRESMLVYKEELELRAKIKTVLADTWPPEYTDIRKIEEILTLLNQTINTNYVLVQLEDFHANT